MHAAFCRLTTRGTLILRLMHNYKYPVA